ncbi:molybdenum ABC transporter, periplasmic molybdate-binding protein [Solidesulfovibrio carbinoliphilus subsp. oakridgensis]|uniref:Molybdenum ABC transporter, periplasmic molybdate-binding protein n=1 Tax=Solidesulfovibrio carbinoliphilus subsp. oakridgensis TaxID=694327 RepID=G7QBS1_9BACT|nr:molybdate ABC transporter substrate-binding protein [Solidesulfovibrio carbinoliphilus]EHJ49414.1 molybdenum ABC transporter, periplasmic molybdate-binding protein [Solidesulfovibrio carbinoliphilus subsp. oakridgensis]
MRKLLLTLALVLALAVPARAADLTVSAAASLTDAFNELKPLFAKDHPGVNVVFNFAASGTLLSQMEQGAPVDVFASADQKTMDQAVEKKLIDTATRANFAQNALVLGVPAGNPAKVKDLASLATPGVRHIAVGNPDSVPVGRYTKAALSKAGAWDGIVPKLVLAESVRQVLDYLSRGEVDAGFVYATDAKQGGDKVKVVAEVPVETPVSYPIAVLAGSADRKDAAAFVAFVKGPKGQEILAKYGFKKP